MTISTENVSNAAWRLRWILGIVAVLHVIAIAVLAIAVLRDPAGMGQTLALWAGYPEAARAPWQNLGLVGIACLNLLMWVMVFALAARVFGRLADGEVEDAAEIARALSLWFWAIFAWALAEPAVTSVISTWHMPEGERSLAISLSAKQVHLALSALVLGCMARALSLGAELWRDHREVV